MLVPNSEFDEVLNFTELERDGIKFEQLIREMFVRSGYEVHWTGVGPDRGRDLVVTENASGGLSNFSRKWLISCKHKAHSNTSVGINDVSDIGDACRAVGADAFFLACSTQPAASVVARFEELTHSGRILCKYWDCVEIERRLQSPELFPLISLFFGESAERYRWKIINTYSPSFWAANYRDYFFYLSSRSAHSFPALNDVENIVARLEGVSLPKGNEAWKRHYLRPRSIFFDDKNEVFSVAVDYIFPKGGESEVVLMKELALALKDGHGLYEMEDGGMYYITYWDIRYIAADQVSDHFHLDHRAYYEPFIEGFRVGRERNDVTGKIIEINRGG